MKRKTIRKLSLLAFCTASAMIASGMAITRIHTAQAASLTGVSVRDFYVSGAGVRLIEDENGKGVRFHTLMSDEIYAKLGDGYTTGTLILPELLYNGDLSVTTDKVMDIDTTGMWYESETDGFMQSTAYVYGIPEASYGVKYVSVSYIKDNTGAYVYSAEGPATAMTDVAQQAMEKDEALTEALTDYVVEEVTVTYAYEGNTEAQTYAYDAKMTPPEEANKTGYNVVWTMPNGQVWDFERQTATGNVTLTANYTQKQSALQNPTASEEAAPEGYGCVSTAPFNQTDTSYMFADMDITGYTQLKFKAKGSVGTYLGSGSGYVGLSTDWREVIVTNNNDGTWKVTLTGYGDNFTISATNLKDVFVWTMWQSSAGTLYTTELQCVEKETPTSDLASFGYKIANTGLADATFFGEFDNVPVYKRTINVSSGGTFGIDFDFSAYDEVRFNFKHTGFGGTSFIGGNSAQISVATDTWYYVSLQKVDGAWDIYMKTDPQGEFTSPYGSGGRPDGLNTANLNGIISFYNWGTMNGEIYMTQVRGFQNVEEEPEEPVLWGANLGNALKNGANVDESAPDGYEKIYSAPFNQADTSYMFADMDITGYTQLKFKAKGSVGTYLGSGSGYVGLSTDWREVIVTNNNDGTWKVTLGAPYGDSFSISATNLKDVFVWTMWQSSAGTLYTTEIRGEEIVVEEPEEPVLWGTNVGSAIRGEVSTTEIPEGYENVYGMSIDNNDKSWAFTDMDITSYSQLKFKAYVQGAEGSVAIGTAWNACVYLTATWREVVATNNNDGTWTVTLTGFSDTFTAEASNLTNLFVWTLYGNGGTLYTTEIRGEKIPLFGENLGGALEDGTDVDETAPDGYENVYSAPFNQADTAYMFADMDITGYTQLKFKAKGSVGTYLGNMSGYIGLGTDWREVILTNNNDGTFTVTVSGYGDSFTRTSTTLKNMFEFTMWQSEAGTLYTTELRGEINPTVSLLNAKGIAVMDTSGTPGYHELQYAADELQYWSKTLLEKDLEIVKTNSIEDVPFGYFVIGYELAQQAGLGEGNLTTDTGYRIENVGGKVYLYGKTKYGALNAVYGLFEKGANLMCFSDGVYTYDEISDIVIEEGVYKEFNPSIDYNWAADGMMTMVSGDYLTKVQTTGATAIIEQNSYGSPYYPNWNYQRRLGFVNSWYILGGGWHNFTTIMPYDTYGSSHPNWYAEITDWSGETVKTLKLSYNNFEMVASVAAEFYTLIKADEAEGHYKTDYIFAPPDSSNWPTNSYGYSASQEYALFMNKLAEYMNANYSFGREINLLMLAYNNTLEAPTGISLYNGSEVDVAVMYAPIQANMYRELSNSTATPDYYGNHTNSYYLGLLNNWQTIAGENKDKVYYWNYSAYYDNYFVPLDTITNMQSTYQTLANSGVKVLFDLGQTGDLVSSDFAALKTFLKGQLAKNVNAVLWTDASTLKGGLVEKFMNAYYGAGAEAMLTLLKTEMDWYKTLADEAVFYNGNTASTTGYEAVGHHSGGGQLLWSSKYWDDESGTWGDKNADSSMLTTWYGYIQTALSAVDGNAELTRRINVESMPIRYLMFRMFNDSDLNNDGTDDNTKEQLIAFAKSLGIVAFTENGAIDSLA